MKSSFRLGRWLDIDVHLHVTFLLMLAFIATAHWLQHQNLLAVLEGIGFFLALFACVLFHEYGHALAARRVGIGTRDITLLPIGGVARLESTPQKPSHEIFVALAGPAVNVAIGAVLALWLSLTNTWEPLQNLSSTNGNFAEKLFAANVALVVFNLIPAFPLDGGRVFRALLSLRLHHTQATRIAASVGQGMALLLGLVGLFSNLSLALIAIFIWFGARQEASATQINQLIGDLPMREAMITDFRALSAQDSLSDASRLLLEGAQRDFPVLEEGRVIGILTQTRLYQALMEGSPWRRVEEVMETDLLFVSPEDPIKNLYLSEVPLSTIRLVSRNGRLIGMITSENLAELIVIQAARTHLPMDQPPPLPLAR